MKHLINSKRITVLSQVLTLVLLVFGFTSPAYSNYACTLDSVDKEGGERINIMLLGDSLTQGKMDINNPDKSFNYRSKLKSLLYDNTSTNIEFLGSWDSLFTNEVVKQESNGNYVIQRMPKGSSLMDFHEGHWGATSKWFAKGEKQVEDEGSKFKGTTTPLYPNTFLVGGERVEGLEKLLPLVRDPAHVILNPTDPNEFFYDPDSYGEDNIADIVLIHLGTNDLRLKYTTDSIIKNLEIIINTFKEKNSSTKFLLAQIIPTHEDSGRYSSFPGLYNYIYVDGKNKIKELNDKILELGINDNSICIVDQYTEFRGKTNSYLSDAFHPKQYAADIMANIWFNALTKGEEYYTNKQTDSGDNITVKPHSDVSIKFSNIAEGGGGITTAEIIPSSQYDTYLPSLTISKENTVVFDIDTTANWSGQITLELDYNKAGMSDNPKIYHIKQDGAELVEYTEIERTGDIVTVKIILDSLSQFVITGSEAVIADSGSWTSICKPQQMEITGIGMGDRYKSTNPQSLSLHNPASIDQILAQVTGRYIRNNGSLQPIDVNFTTPNGELKTLTQPSYQNQFGYSYVLPLAPASEVNATVQGSGESNEKTPRGLVLYALRDTQGEAWSSIGQILNEYTWGGGSDEDDIYSKTITFPPLQEKTDLYVTAVVTDNNNDLRSMVVEAEAGGVISNVSEDVPTEGDLLNIVELKLAAVPAGITEAVITLRSLAVEGDSLIFSGVNVSYPCAKSERVQDSLEALYSFQEGSGGTVQDISGIGAPLNLTIVDESATSWLAGGGLAINAPTIIQSTGAASKVITASQASNELTIEAWIKPANVTQDGPARIVTLSQDSLFRNFTLGQGLWGSQASDVYGMRLRSTVTSLNGMPSLTSSAGVATTNLTHIVYTREASSLVRIYVDNEEVHIGRIPGDFSNWNANYALSLANELSQDRPWLGELHLVAIYSKALSSDEVSQNYTAGSGTTP